MTRPALDRHPPHGLRRRQVLAAGAAGLAAVLPAWAQPGAWPSKPVKLVVPFAPGGSTDVVARMLGQRFGELWGQAVVIENRAGAGGNLGTDAVAKAAPDGYTLLLTSGAITISPALSTRLPFDTKKDLQPISNVASGPMLVVVSDKSPHRTLKDLIMAAKAAPGTVTFGSAGVGSQVHLAAENFAFAAGIEVQHVPYKGESVAYTDLIGGQIQMMVGNIAAAAALLGNGRLRALAVTGLQRSPLLPDVPTCSESGLPGFENTGWFGLFAPAGTPRDVVARLHRDAVTVLGETQVKARLYVLGMVPVASNPAELSQQMDTEMARWATVVKSRKLMQN